MVHIPKNGGNTTTSTALKYLDLSKVSSFVSQAHLPRPPSPQFSPLQLTPPLLKQQQQQQTIKKHPEEIYNYKEEFYATAYENAMIGYILMKNRRQQQRQSRRPLPPPPPFVLIPRRSYRFLGIYFIATNTHELAILIHEVLVVNLSVSCFYFTLFVQLVIYIFITTLFF